LSTQVIIGSLQVTLTASSTSPPVGTAVTFTVNGVSTAAVDHFVWSFDDGTPSFSTSGPQISHVFTSRGLKTVAVDVFGVGGGKLGSATTQVTVQ